MAKLTKATEPLDTASGRDEMNLAEFPIALLSNREPDDGSPLVFETSLGKLTITATHGPREKGNGLPTASDTDVLIGLLQLTKRANNFTEPTVYFSRYELLRLIRWPDGTKSYRRLRAALKRWAKVSLDYEKSWYDNRRKCRVDATFHILNSVIVYERSGKELPGDPGQQADPPSSRFTWGTEFFKSCQENYLKRLDLDVYFSLKSSATKQLYRFLDKHFYERDTLTYDLEELAAGHIGLSANYTIPRIKEKLAPCLDELVQIGFIEPATKEQRYTKTGHGQWDVTFRKKAREEAPLLEVASKPDHPLAQELINRGVTPITARELVMAFPAEAIVQKLEVFDWLIGKKDKRASKNPAGYLAKSIRDGFKPPEGFKSKAQVEAERLAAEKAEQELAARKLAARSKDAKELAEKAAVDAHLASLTQEQRAELEREAFAASELNTKLFGRIIVRDHVRKLLKMEG
jgi:Replication initiator protein A